MRYQSASRRRKFEPQFVAREITVLMLVTMRDWGRCRVTGRGTSLCCRCAKHVTGTRKRHAESIWPIPLNPNREFHGAGAAQCSALERKVRCSSDGRYVASWREIKRDLLACTNNNGFLAVDVNYHRRRNRKCVTFDGYRYAPSFLGLISENIFIRHGHGLRQRNDGRLH